MCNISHSADFRLLHLCADAAAIPTASTNGDRVLGKEHTTGMRYTTTQSSNVCVEVYVEVDVTVRYRRRGKAGLKRGGAGLCRVGDDDGDVDDNGDNISNDDMTTT